MLYTKQMDSLSAAAAFLRAAAADGLRRDSLPERGIRAMAAMTLSPERNEAFYAG